MEEEDGKVAESAPDSAHMVRRGALVPPKMDPDDIDPGGGAGGPNERSDTQSVDNKRNTLR